MYGLCIACGYLSPNHAQCQRCRRVFTEKPQKIPFRSTPIDLPPIRLTPMDTVKTSTSETTMIDNIRPAAFIRGDVADLKDAEGAMAASFRAKKIYLGTYGSEPQKYCLFTSRGIRLAVPNLKRPTELIVLNIHKHEIVRAVYHFSAKCCVIFIYVTSQCSKYVRDQIEMDAGCNGSHFSTFSDVPAEKRITIQIDLITESAKAVIKDLFSPSVGEETHLEDAELLLEQVTNYVNE